MTDILINTSQQLIETDFFFFAFCQLLHINLSLNPKETVFDFTVWQYLAYTLCACMVEQDIQLIRAIILSEKHLVNIQIKFNQLD